MNEMFIKETNKRKNNKGVGNIFLMKNDKNLLLGSRILNYNDDGWEDTDSSYDDMDVVAM